MIAFALRFIAHRITLRECKTQPELLYDVIANATTTEILLTNGNTIDIVFEDFVKVLTGPLVDHEHRLAVTLFALLVVRQFTFLYLDIVFLGQPAQRFGIGNLLVLHQEVDGIAALATGKALAYLTRWRDHERRRLVIVERTQALVVHARLTQVHELTYHINNVGGFHDFINCRSVNHDAKLRKKIEPTKKSARFFNALSISLPRHRKHRSQQPRLFHHLSQRRKCQNVATFQRIPPLVRKVRKQWFATTYHQRDEVSATTIVIMSRITWTISRCHHSAGKEYSPT